MKKHLSVLLLAFLLAYTIASQDTIGCQASGTTDAVASQFLDVTQATEAADTSDPWLMTMVMNLMIFGFVFLMIIISFLPFIPMMLMPVIVVVVLLVVITVIVVIVIISIKKSNKTDPGAPPRRTAREAAREHSDQLRASLEQPQPQYSSFQQQQPQPSPYGVPAAGPPYAQQYSGGYTQYATSPGPQQAPQPGYDMNYGQRFT